MLNYLKDLQVKSFVPGRLQIKMPASLGLSRAQMLWTRIVASGIAESIKITGLTQSVLIYYDKRKYSQAGFVKQLLGAIGVSAAATSLVEAKFLSTNGRAKATPPKKSVGQDHPKAAPATVLSLAERNALRELTWRIESDTPGRLRLHHPLVHKYAIVAQKVEFTLVNLDGVNDYDYVSGRDSAPLCRAGLHNVADQHRCHP
jgi:hypothetical protein